MEQGVKGLAVEGYSRGGGGEGEGHGWKMRCAMGVEGGEGTSGRRDVLLGEGAKKGMGRGGVGRRRGERVVDEMMKERGARERKWGKGGGQTEGQTREGKAGSLQMLKGGEGEVA